MRHGEGSVQPYTALQRNGGVVAPGPVAGGFVARNEIRAARQKLHAARAEHCRTGLGSSGLRVFTDPRPFRAISILAFSDIEGPALGDAGELVLLLASKRARAAANGDSFGVSSVLRSVTHDGCGPAARAARYRPRYAVLPSCNQRHESTCSAVRYVLHPRWHTHYE